MAISIALTQRGIFQPTELLKNLPLFYPRGGIAFQFVPTYTTLTRHFPIGKTRKRLAINGRTKIRRSFWKATALPLSYTRAPGKLTRLATAAKSFLNRGAFSFALPFSGPRSS